VNEAGIIQVGKNPIRQIKFIEPSRRQKIRLVRPLILGGRLRFFKYIWSWGEDCDSSSILSFANFFTRTMLALDLCLNHDHYTLLPGFCKLPEKLLSE
jgi:hypothetical protein